MASQPPLIVVDTLRGLAPRSVPFASTCSTYAGESSASQTVASVHGVERMAAFTVGKGPRAALLSSLRRLLGAMATPLLATALAALSRPAGMMPVGLLANGIGSIKDVAAVAMCLCRVTNATTDVLQSRHRFEMLRIKASAISAQMIEMQSRWDWADEQFVCDPMRAAGSALPAHLNVPVLRYCAWPEPAIIRLRGVGSQSVTKVHALHADKFTPRYASYQLWRRC